MCAKSKRWRASGHTKTARNKQTAVKRAVRTAKSPDTLALEKRLSDALGLTVGIDQRRGGGTLSIRYRNLDQLDEVLRRLERRH